VTLASGLFVAPSLKAKSSLEQIGLPFVVATLLPRKADFGHKLQSSRAPRSNAELTDGLYCEDSGPISSADAPGGGKGSRLHKATNSSVSACNVVQKSSWGKRGAVECQPGPGFREER
jgi:hypothetical protein